MDLTPAPDAARAPPYGANLSSVDGTLERTVGLALATLTAVQVPILIGLAWLLGAPVAIVTFTATALAAAPFVLRFGRRPIRLVGLALAMGLTGQTAVLVFIFSGHPWQVEMHFYFFVVLAMLACLCDPVVLITGAALVVFHHFILNFLLPAALYPGGVDVFRLGVHGLVVMIETGVLVVFGRWTITAFQRAATAEMAAHRTADRLASLAAAHQEEATLAGERSLHLELVLDAFRKEVNGHLKQLAGEADKLGMTADDFSSVVAKTTAEAVALAKSVQSASRRVEESALESGAYLETMSHITSHASLSITMGRDAGLVAESAATTIDQLIAMTARIDETTTLITAISQQTNLLALNATIEAARAGEHGRGFSVVASEVKELSSHTTKAAASIDEMVMDIQSIAGRATGEMASIGKTIRGLNEAATTIAESVAERVQSATQMSNGNHAAAADVRAVATSIEKIRSVAEESARSATYLRHAASEIGQQTHLIRQKVDHFADGWGGRHAAPQAAA